MGARSHAESALREGSLHRSDNPHHMCGLGSGGHVASASMQGVRSLRGALQRNNYGQPPCGVLWARGPYIESVLQQGLCREARGIGVTSLSCAYSQREQNSRSEWPRIITPSPVTQKTHLAVPFDTRIPSHSQHLTPSHKTTKQQPLAHPSTQTYRVLLGGDGQAVAVIGNTRVVLERDVAGKAPGPQQVPPDI